MPIPKLIHQTYSSFEAIKPEIRDHITTLRAANPNYTYNFYSEQDRIDFIRSHYGPELLATYLKIDPVYGAARADLFRYLVVHACGGVYLDIKSGASRPLDQVIANHDSCILSRWDHSPGSPYQGWGNHPEIAPENRPAFQQWFIISEPGHPFLAAVIERVCSNIETFNPFRHWRNAWNAVMVTTGDIPYTNVIVPLLASHPHRLVSIEQDMGISYTIFQNTLGIYAHHQPGRHYTTQTRPLIRQPWPLSLFFASATQARLLARSLRSRLC